MKMRKLVSLLLALAMVFALASCGGQGEESNPGSQGGSQSGAEGELDYTYEDGHFYSETPVTYTIYLQDNAAYPYKDTWKTEGVFKAIKDKTNVELDVKVIDWNDYSNSVTLALTGSDAPYIIPKIYSETAYVSGGGVVPVSEYVKYMPNYSAFVEEYGMATDLESILQEDGKYYRLPGLKETCLQDYTFLVRQDLFEGAGIDVAEEEKDWTWDEFVDILIKVKEYMVAQGIVSQNDYIWSDMWCGETGANQGGNLLKLIGASYGVYSGWAITSNYGLIFDANADEFVDGSISENYKQMMTVIQKLVDNKILDPETFTQQDDVAGNKFYRGETALISTNRAQYTAQEEGIKGQLGEGNYKLYRAVVPVGTTNYQADNERLECGVMISSKALKDLGEDGFIKMMRFVDWLWYSEEGLTLTKWGVEGETYTVTDGVYSLTDGYYCGGLSIPQTNDNQVDMRLELGYACGNFMYGGNLELLTSNFDESLQDFYSRVASYRELRPMDPHIAMSEDDQEMMSMYGTTLTDTVNTWTLKFAMRQADINSDWDEYVAAVQGAQLQNVLDTYNRYYKASK